MTRTPESIRRLWTDEWKNDLQCYLYEFDALENSAAHVKSEHRQILFHYMSNSLRAKDSYGFRVECRHQWIYKHTCEHIKL